MEGDAVTRFDLLAWGTAQVVSTLKAAHAEAVAVLPAVAAAPSAPQPPAADAKTAVDSEGEQTMRVRQLLAEQHRKRPELDVNWSAFSVPELQTFLCILAAEEELHRQQVGAEDKGRL